MAKTIFPAGVIVNTTTIDLEVMKHYSLKWGIERVQLEKGLYRGSMNAGHTPHIQLGLTHNTRGIHVQADLPPGTILMTFVMSDAPSSFQNRLLREHELVIAKKFKDVDLISSSMHSVFTIAIDEELFDRTFNDYFNKPAEVMLNDQRVFVESDKLNYFVTGLSNWITYLQSDEYCLALVNDYDVIELEMLYHIFSCMTFEVRSIERVKFNIKSARDLLHDSMEKNISIAQLAQELKVSEDHLLYAFKENYGLSPKKYLQSLRLNAIRKELLLADPNSAKVSDIAFKYGYKHMSHFASEYKKVFSELPSVTISKR